MLDAWSTVIFIGDEISPIQNFHAEKTDRFSAHFSRCETFRTMSPNIRSDELGGIEVIDWLLFLSSYQRFESAMLVCNYTKQKIWLDDRK